MDHIVPTTMQDILNILFKENIPGAQPVWELIPEEQLGEEKDKLKAIGIVPLIRYIYNVQNNKPMSYKWAIWLQLKQVEMFSDPTYELCIRTILKPDTHIQSILNQLSISEKLTLINSLNDNIAGGSICYANDNFVYSIKTLLPPMKTEDEKDDTLQTFLIRYMQYVVFHCSLTTFHILTDQIKEIGKNLENMAIVRLADIDTSYRASHPENKSYLDVWTEIIAGAAKQFHTLILDIANWQPEGALDSYLTVLKALQTNTTSTLMFYDSSIELPTDVEKQIDNPRYTAIYEVLVKCDPNETRVNKIANIRQYDTLVVQLANQLYERANQLAAEQQAQQEQQIPQTEKQSQEVAQTPVKESTPVESENVYTTDENMQEVASN